MVSPSSARWTRGPRTGAEEAWGDKACALPRAGCLPGRQPHPACIPRLSEQGRGDCKMAEERGSWGQAQGGHWCQARWAQLCLTVANRGFFKGHQRRDFRLRWNEAVADSSPLKTSANLKTTVRGKRSEAGNRLNGKHTEKCLLTGTC